MLLITLYKAIIGVNTLTADSRDSSQSRDGSVEMADSVATVEMDLDDDERASEMASELAVAENAAAIGPSLMTTSTVG